LAIGQIDNKHFLVHIFRAGPTDRKFCYSLHII